MGFVLVIILVLAMVLAVEAINNQPVFKHTSDKHLYESGIAPQVTLDRIRLLNKISVEESGKPIVVTSLFRADDTDHSRLAAFDARRLSEANENFPQYTKEDVEKIEKRAASEGLPIYIIAKGTSVEHWHIGRIKYATT